MEQTPISKFSINESIKFAWELFKQHVWYFVVLMIIFFGISLIFGSIEDALEDSPIRGLVSLISYLVNVVIGMAIIKIILEFLDGNPKPNWDKISSSFSMFWNYLGATILTSIIIVVGLVFLIIPGIYAALRFQFVSYLVIDKGLSPFDALRESSKLTQGIKFELLLLFLAVFGLNLVGVLAVGVGLLVSVPVTMIAMTHVYRKLIGQTPVMSNNLPTDPEVHIGDAVPTDEDEDLLK